MSTLPLSRDQVRRVDQISIEKYGIPGLILMENAGRAAAEVIHTVAPAGSIAILCGKGNNGGDGYVIARHLDIVGRKVKLFSTTGLSDLGGDAKINATIADNLGIEIEVCDRKDSLNAEAILAYSVIVDCLLGTGAVGNPRGRIADWVRIANASEAMRIAIDLPTGLDCDTGQANIPTFVADHTITMVAPKIGFNCGEGSTVVGKVHQVGIGIPCRVVDEAR
ncbi:Bifunctional NAD(P)H-hydrate repair enzyme Nnr [Rubripirellula tenax]|uniref:NAD(P)H-hydrate epimerase n=1 Tax=Rubripirellula tenax TaxID=2528015 RepID=A0A5C6FJI7_9BACT|nr:NAD(P)H-hydrate epimerase [Rubripirellula tenax]TWU60209.1 Bifunctional NAD(P)H-hydrate repair enzyme Nnr [Rubripirellula tenax]